VLAPGDFAEAVGNLERVGERLLQRFIIGARSVELALSRQARARLNSAEGLFV